MNKVILQGRLTKDPEIKHITTTIANFNLAVNRRYIREGEPDADFIQIVTFGRNAENLQKYIQKGDLVAIVGRLQVRSYNDNDGNRKWITNVVAEEVHYCGSSNKRNTNYSNREIPPEVAGDGFVPIDEGFDDDLPF